MGWVKLLVEQVVTGGRSGFAYQVAVVRSFPPTQR